MRCFKAVRLSGGIWDKSQERTVVVPILKHAKRAKQKGGKCHARRKRVLRQTARPHGRSHELESLFESMKPDSGVLPEAFEQFLGGIFNKATKLVRGAVKLAKRGIKAVGGLLPAQWVLTQTDIEKWYRDAKLDWGTETEHVSETKEKDPSPVAQNAPTPDLSANAGLGVPVLETDRPRRRGRGAGD